MNGGIVNDATCPVPGVDNTRSRDANVYTSRITQDFSFTAPSNSKHNAPGVIRAFAVQLANNRELNPASSGKITGLTGLEQGLGLEFVPAVVASGIRDNHAGETDSSLEPSLDVSYKPTPALTA